MNNYATPYYNFNSYGNYYQQRQQPMQQINSMAQPMQPMEQPTFKQPILQGKVVDNAKVVEVAEIPFDGSISYFPLTDNSAIITKQLQMDGTSKTVVYKPVDEPTEAKEQPKYVTVNELDELKENIEKLSTDDIKGMKRQIEDILEELKRIKKKGSE